jgi:ADP-ribosyl-[dinitrogen reductase] hydrolase
MPSPSVDSIRGVLLGTAVGDTIGLPYEGLSARRVGRWAPKRLCHGFLLRRGMVSDDTEHTALVAIALASTRSPGDFQSALARGLRRWLLTGPGGVGLATLRALLKLNLGFSPERSGVDSAGNGPAMRAALLGLCVDLSDLPAYARANTRLTHTDPRA